MDPGGTHGEAGSKPDTFVQEQWRVWLARGRSWLAGCRSLKTSTKPVALEVSGREKKNPHKTVFTYNFITHPQNRPDDPSPPPPPSLPSLSSPLSLSLSVTTSSNSLNVSLLTAFCF